ncbi:hypothetical protein ACFLTK_03240 [Chloroflexota bacterium]
MPGKSQRSRGKHSSRNKQLKSKQGSLIVAQTPEPLSRPDAAASSMGEPTPAATPSTVRYPYIVTELRRIGILGGIMLVILIVLALVIS